MRRPGSPPSCGPSVLLSLTSGAHTAHIGRAHRSHVAALCACCIHGSYAAGDFWARYRPPRPAAAARVDDTTATSEKPSHEPSMPEKPHAAVAPASRSVESSVREGNLQCVAVPAAARVLVDAIDSVGAHVERAVVEGGTGVDAKITSRDVNLVRRRHRRVQRRG